VKNLILALSATLVFSVSLCLASEKLSVDPETIKPNPSSSGTMAVSSLPQGVYTVSCKVEKSSDVSTLLQISSLGVTSFGPITLNGQEMNSARSPLKSGYVYNGLVDTVKMDLVINNVRSQDQSLYFQNITGAKIENPPTLTIDQCSAKQNKN